MNNLTTALWIGGCIVFTLMFLLSSVAVLFGMCRANHTLGLWRRFCDAVRYLPLFWLLSGAWLLGFVGTVLAVIRSLVIGNRIPPTK